MGKKTFIVEASGPRSLRSLRSRLLAKVFLLAGAALWVFHFYLCRPLKWLHGGLHEQ